MNNTPDDGKTVAGDESADSEQPESGTRRSRRQFLAGLVGGVLIVLAGRGVIERTPLVDWFITPLALADTSGRADVIVVLGAGMTQLCTPNLHGLQRVLLAADLYHKGRAPLVLFVGGRPTGAMCSLSETMSALAERLGVPRARIRIETSSASTWENAQRGDAVLRALGARRILLVTDRPHLSRAEACFRRFGYAIERAGVPVPLAYANNTSLLMNGLREYAAWAYYRIRGYVSDAPAEAALSAPVSNNEYESADHHAMTIDINPVHLDGPLVILGASYARNWNLVLEGLRVENRGVAGQQSFELLARFPQDVVELKPRAVILWGFVNDVFRTPRPEIGSALSRARASFEAMIALARGARIEPIIATEVTIGLKAGWGESLANLVGGVLGRQGYHDYVNRHVMDTNAWLREFARREGVVLLDLERVLAGETGGLRARAYTADDGSHLTAAGYQALTKYSQQILHEHFHATAR